MAEFREPGVTNTVTMGNLGSSGYFVLATPVGQLDELVPQDVFINWVEGQISGGGGSGRVGGFDNLGTVTGNVTLDFTAGNFNNKQMSLTGPVTLQTPTATDPGAYELLLESNGHAVTWAPGWSLDADPVVSSSGWSVIRLYYLPDSSWTF